MSARCCVTAVMTCWSEGRGSGDVDDGTAAAGV
jgi:hypothetical protein